MKREGFTLIEMMIVIIIIGIMTAIAVPSFQAMNERNALEKGRALIQDTVLRAKSHAATGIQDWQIFFDGPNNQILSGPLGLPATVTETLPRRCKFSNAALALTFEFYRDGTANSNPIANLSFSIENDKKAGVLFTLVPQIGEVKTHGN